MTAIILIITIYAVLIIFYSITFRISIVGTRRGTSSTIASPTVASATIIVSARNEETTIIPFLDHISQQSIPLILIDDHSTDSTYSKALEYRSRYDFTLIQNPGNGKKAALAAALKYVETPYMLFTDCDCIPSPDWAKCMINTAIEQNADMVLAPVIIKAKNQKSLFQRLWQAESMSLITLTAASAITRRPLMCNGGNMLVSTSLRRQAEGHINNKYLSGDDIFLLQFAVSEHKKIVYAKSPSTAVSTFGPETLRALLRQRGRWVSKTGGYTDWFTILVALLVFAANISVIVGAVISVINGWWYIFIILWLLKFIADALSVRIPSAYYHIPVRWLDILALAVVYPFYTLACTVIGMTRKTVWR